MPRVVKLITQKKDNCEHTDKIDIMEKIIGEITFQVIKVDQELKHIKEQIKLHKTKVNNKVDTHERENVAEDETNKFDADKHGPASVCKGIEAKVSRDLYEKHEKEFKCDECE